MRVELTAAAALGMAAMEGGILSVTAGTAAAAEGTVAAMVRVCRDLLGAAADGIIHLAAGTAIMVNTIDAESTSGITIGTIIITGAAEVNTVQHPDRGGCAARRAPRLINSSHVA